MTRVLIEGQEVVLPEDFSPVIIEENPFFTKNGKYTYDIKLSLKNPSNARIYKHYNRLNNSAELVSKRTAVGISDNRVWLNGTEVILEINDDSVSIQLVSGNSELNYLIGGELKIRTMDLGTAVVSPNGITWRLDHPYPEYDWVLLPFANNENDSIGNDYYHYNSSWDNQFGQNELVLGPLKYAYDGVHLFKNSSNQNTKYLNYRPQPYLCFIISKILQSLGYTLTTNMIATHNVFKYYYLVHGYDTLAFAEMLPDWTAKTFFEEIEKFFDCTVIIKEDKTVDILFNYYYETINEQQKLEIIDEFTCPIDSENKLSHQNVNIGYALDSEEYYKLARIDGSIKDVAINVDLAELLTIHDLIDKVTDANDALRYNKIFNEVLGTFYRYISYNDGSDDIPKKIDAFVNLMNNPDDDENINMEFNIIPAAMKTGTKTITAFNSQGYAITLKFYWQCPVAEYADPFFLTKEDDDPDYTLQGLISGVNSLPAKTLTAKMRLAIYNGQKPKYLFDYRDGGGASISPLNTGGGSNLLYPFPFVESLCEYFKSEETYARFFENVNPFRLSWMYNNIYSLTQNINTERTYKFKFLDPGLFDIRSKFLINNREFLCQKVERHLAIDGINKLLTGYFYPIG